MNIGNTGEALREKSILHDGDRLISERAFNLILGGTLLWGFILNYLTITVFGNQALRMAAAGNDFMFYIGYLVCVLAGSFMIAFSSPLLSFVGFNLIAAPVGVVLTVAVAAYPAIVVKDAVMYTGLITALFVFAGVMWPEFFMSMGRVIVSSLGILIIVEMIVGIFTGNWASMDLAAAAIFAMFIGIDWARCTVCQPTANNAVDCAANLYLDIINLFLRLLRILAKSRKD